MNKRIPTIKANIGDWVSYTGTLSFGDISKFVSKVDDELHSSSSLNEAIQRGLTSNYLSIKNYILNQEERFFNAIVLAVYDGKPNWIEVELELEGDSYYDLGFLSLSGEEKIFPVDGQHRVEAIKEALAENPNLIDEKISVIFISHKKTNEGMQRSRRLFNALNRYAKPVKMSDIIALDEDDTSAISTRHLLEDSNKVSLFKNDRVIFAQQKAIPDKNKKAITSLITFYQCNNALLKYFYSQVFSQSPQYADFKNYFCNNKERAGNFLTFMKFRPSNEVIDNFIRFNEEYWEAFVENIEDIEIYQNSTSSMPANQYRNMDIGGHILFRPIGLLPFVEASLHFKQLKKIGIKETIRTFSNIEFSLNQKPWVNTVWNPQNGKMETSISKSFIKNMMLYLVDARLLNEKQTESLKKDYASKISYDKDINTISLQELLAEN